ncbi:MAG: hypothetical protein RL336_1020 [Pseudomonadota bacterium]|jgi:hypothetical protein
MKRDDPNHPGNPSIADQKWQPRSYFETPDDGIKPLSFWETFRSILLGHLGVATAKQREEDFARANGWHVLWVGILYTAIVTFIMIGTAVYLAY